MGVVEALREREKEFIERRAKIEMEVNSFLTSVDKTNDERITSVPGRPAGSTAKEVLPALWAEPFDKEAYALQLGALNHYIAALKAKCNELAEEAERCIQECNPI